jgi:hypothetical protein
MPFRAPSETLWWSISPSALLRLPPPGMLWRALSLVLCLLRAPPAMLWCPTIRAIPFMTIPSGTLWRANSSRLRRPSGMLEQLPSGTSWLTHFSSSLYHRIFMARLTGPVIPFTTSTTRSAMALAWFTDLLSLFSSLPSRTLWYSPTIRWSALSRDVNNSTWPLWEHNHKPVRTISRPLLG